MSKRDHIIEAVQEALSIDTRVYDRRDIFPRKSLTVEECSAAQLANVLKSIAPGCPAEDILLIVDTSNGKGTRGLVFTEHTMYLSKDMRRTGMFNKPVPQPFRYEDYIKIDKDDQETNKDGQKSGSGLEIIASDGQRHVISGPYTAFLLALRKCLNQAMLTLKKEKEEQQKEALARSAGEIIARGEALAAAGDFSGMVQCFAEAAETGDGEAMYRYAQIIKDYGQEDLVLSYLKKAADQGHAQAEAEYRRLKDRQDQEYAQAVADYQAEEYEKAAYGFVKLARRGVAKACYQSGYLYWNGKGVSQNNEIAFSYFKNAADIGYTPGMKACADFYRNGRGVKEDRGAAYAMLEKAAGLGDVDAKLSLWQDRTFDLYDIFCENLK